MKLYLIFFYRFLLSTAMIIFFYYYVKLYLFYIAPKIATYLKITKYYSMEISKGIIELPLVVLFHFLFVVTLLCFLAIPTVTQSFDLEKIVFYLLIGIFLGVGMMSFSSLLCRAIIEIFRHIPKSYFPLEIKDWLIMTRSGWLRHYLHTVEVLPLFLSLSIVFFQVFCEEMMFRGILINYFSPTGSWIAIMSSTILFMFMQLFHMPTLVSGIFPLIGSMVIGLINGMLYLKFFNLLPLVIAHFTFFVVAVL